MISTNVVEYLRREAVESCFNLSAFQNGWPTWKAAIHEITGRRFTSRNLLLLGDNLSKIFLSTRDGGRGQSQVSGGGYGWEGLVCWYLNLCLCGSRAVAIKKVSNLPSPLRDALSVNYGTFVSNTESDITIVVFPDQPHFLGDKEEIPVFDFQGKPIPKRKPNGKFNASPILEKLADTYFNEFEMGVIQCKTNWNDNAQIPMLWSMIYEASFPNSRISVGRNGYSIQEMRKFTYSFCTVPTNNLSNYKTTSTSVQRVRNLTGGNYWGRETSSGVASSLKEIFNANFQSAFSASSQRTLLDAVMDDWDGELSYFDLI